MKKIHKLLGPSGQNGFIFSVFLLLLLSFYPTMYEARQQPNIQKGRVLVLEHGWTPDFNLYLSKMRQGAEGRWSVVERYTNMDHQGSLLQIFYLLLGKVGSWFGLSIVATYHLSRLIFGASLLLMTYLLAVRLFPKSLWALFAFWLVVTTSSWPIAKIADLLSPSFWGQIIHGKEWFGSYLSWWTILDPHKRITVMPHILAGQTLILVILYLFFYLPEDISSLQGKHIMSLVENVVRKGKVISLLGKGVGLGLIGLIQGFVFPPALIMTYVAVWGGVALQVIYNLRFTISLKEGQTNKPVSIKEFMPVFRNRNQTVKTILTAFIFVAVSFPVFFYLAYITSFYPWKRLNDINFLEPHRFPIHEFVLANGPALVLASIATVIILWRKKREFFPVISWMIGIFTLMIAIRAIPSQNALRFTEVAHFVPVGLLAAYGVKAIYNLRLPVFGKRDSFILLKTFAMAASLFTIGLGLGHLYYGLKWKLAFIHQRVIATLPSVARPPQVMYPWKEFMDTIYWLDKNTPSDAVIFADETFGGYIPAYSSRRVFCCHANTPGKEEKLGMIWQFYQGKLGDVEAVHAWLKNFNLSYVLYGPQEREVSGMVSIDDIADIYPFLSIVYKNARVKVYRVK